MPSARTAQHVALARSYADSVIRGKTPACRWVRLTVERFLGDLDRWRGKDQPYRFDEDAAERVCDIIRRFPHVRGDWARDGRKLELEPWQCFIVCNVFGWKVTATDKRRFRTVYIEVPRKNAKSTLTAAIGNYMLACDGEHGAQVVSAANAIHQAKLVFADAQHMARREKGFQARFGIEVLAHAIVQQKTASKFEALSAEYGNLDGLNLHAALIDELHAHPSRGLWDVLETATGSRTQSLIWAITTAGTNRASVCYDQRGHVIDVLSKLVKDESYFGIIYTIDDGDDPWEEPTWIKANPNWGISVLPDSIRPEGARAQVMPSAQNAFLTKHLDVWVNADVAWLPAGAWDRCADPKLDQEDFEHQECYIGIDLAWRSDIAAMVAAFPPTSARDYWAVFGFYYLPDETVNRSENSHYQGWEAAGHLTATQGAITDYDYILDDLERLSSRFEVLDIALDPAHAGTLITGIESRGLRKPIEIRQNASTMTPAMLEMEGLILDRSIHHDGDPILAWMMSNVKINRRAGDLVMPSKESEEKKIDGVTALLMCIVRGIRQGPRADYENRGLWVI
jgi:phage terminase large subunit-like protein